MDGYVLTEQVEGYPSFVRRAADNPSRVNWWAPFRSGDADADYAAGQAHFHVALDMLKGLRDPSSLDFYRALIAPVLADPRSILANIVEAMRVSGPMECGFVHALAVKAVAGRAPGVGSGPGVLDEDRSGEEYAHACLELARIAGVSFITDELIATIDQTVETSLAPAFVWTVCAAAFAGASN